MLNNTFRALSAYAIALALALASSGAASAGVRQDTQQKNDEKNKDKKDKSKDKDQKKDSSANAENEKQSKQESQYQKIRTFSVDLYAKDPGFREEVEETFRQKLREHSEYAFFVNTRDAQDDQITRTGDKLKVDDSLYDNPLVQDYVNRLGQSVVPKESTHLFAFKVTLNPIPEARTLSTGTVYISSGLLSAVDNEAQLAYVLGHEIAHIDREHWHQDVLVERGMEHYNEKQQQKRGLIGGVASMGIGGLTGGLTGSAGKAGLAALFAQAALPSILKLAMPNAVASWDKAQEDEADQLALKYMLDRSYDPREAPKFYAALQRTSQRDSRASLGFMADATRVVERVQQVNTLVGGMNNLSTSSLYVGAAAYQARRNAGAAAPAQPQAAGTDIGKGINPERDAALRADTASKAITSGPLSEELKAKLESGELIGSSAEFEAVMAELRRDNGVRAFYYDMFQMARDNLEESLRIRANDPAAHYYYGKVLKLTARSAPEKQLALMEFVKAVELDKRGVIGEPRLYRALAMIDARDASQTPEIVSSLKDYVSIYQREHGGQLPPNMDVIYDYLQEVGEFAWAAHPAMNVSTKNIDPIGIDGAIPVAASPATAVAAPLVVAPPAAPPTAPSPKPTTAPGPKPQPRRP